ncbi:MAG: hypothetical protein K9N34_04740 [Candidatus Marinimicrobia bacterium]|nr:hypothetical protein [Candidatus Neomarinimicrobiota bacterium]MCF7840537.1 hypothetical protein [Candidatus Neomarinimicrobiota bacterium]
MKRNRILLVLSGALFLAACTDLMLKPEMPSWDFTMEFPLTKQVVNTDELLDQPEIKRQAVDEFGNPLPAGTELFVYKDTIDVDPVEVGDQLTIEDINKNFSQTVDNVTVDGTQTTKSVAFDEVGVNPIEKSLVSRVGTIELDNIAPTSTDPFTLREIAPVVEDVNNGETDSIPSAPIAPIVKPFTFSDFQSATFVGGQLDISIANDMVIDLGRPVDLQLQELVGTDTVDIPGASVTWNALIPTGTEDTQVLDLTGMTLPGNIFVKISGYSYGSQQQNITMSDEVKNSSFVVNIAASNLQVSSAEAVVPTQEIDETSSIELSDSTNKVERAKIKRGNMAVNISNNMSVAANLVITVTSLEGPAGGVFEETIPLAANATANEVYSLANHFMVMTLASQQVDYSYHVETVSTDPNFVLITDTDSIEVGLSLYGANPGEDIVFSTIRGIIESQDKTIDGDIPVTSDSEILRADIASGGLDINIYNGINETQGGTPQLTLQINQLFDSNGDTLRVEGVNLDPGDNLLNINLTNHALQMPQNDQTLYYSAHVVTPEGELGTYNLLDSIVVEINVSTLTFSEIEGYFTQDAIVDSNVVELNNDTKVENALINRGDLKLTIRNYIGVQARSRFTINEIVKNGQPFQGVLEIGQDSAPQDSTFDLAGYEIQLPLDDQVIHYKSRISIPSSVAMTLSLEDSIAINMNIANLSFDQVDGIVAPIEVEIDTIRQELSGMPDELDDFNFSRVDMTLAFDSQISIPVFLDLSIIGTASDGQTVTAGVSNWNITDSSDVVIPSDQATNLINLHPDEITVFGLATVGDGVSQGSAASNDSIKANFVISIPMSFVLGDSTELKMDAEAVDAGLPEDLQGITLFADINNRFAFGAQLTVLTSPDSTVFDDPPSGIPDTLLTLTIPPGQESYQEIDLQAGKLSLLKERTFLKNNVFLMGERDSAGVAIPSRFFSTDSMEIKLSGRAKVRINGEEGGAS